MRFKNNTGEHVKARLKDEQGLDYFKSVYPTDEIDLPVAHGESLGLDPIEKPDMPEPDKPSPEPVESKEYLKFLTGINGIGKKTAKDIMSKYPTMDRFRTAIESGEHLPVRDDLAELLEESIIFED